MPFKNAQLAPDLETAAVRLAQIAKDTAAEAERERRVSQDLIAFLRKSGTASHAAPAAVGGTDPVLTDLLDLIRRVARADASAGWVTMIYLTSAAGAHWVPSEGLSEIFQKGRSTLLAGVVAPRGRATPTANGFSLSGRWAFGSGAADADWVGLGATIDEVRSGFFYVPRERVQIIDTWDVVGLRASASHDLAVDGIEIPTGRVAYLDGPPSTDEALARFPVFGLLAAGIGAVAIGVGEAAVEEAIELAGGKTPTGSRRRLADRAAVQEAVARAQANLESAWFYLAHVAAPVEGMAAIAEKVRLRLAATKAVEMSRQAVDAMYTLAGGTSLYARSPLQRYLRDIHTATQHMMVAQPTWELTGRVILGIETEPTGL